MTHDELLAKITGYQPFLYSLQPLETAQHIGRIENNALRAVVELHKPYVPAFIEADVARDGGGTCLHCSLLAGDSLSVPHPCPTIQAIEKELK